MRKAISQMSLTEIFLRATRRFALSRSLVESVIRTLVKRPGSRAAFNRYFSEFSAGERTIFQNLTSKAFRRSEPEVEDGTWLVKFREYELKMPLRRGSMWLDWDNAVSITGHDSEIKQTYENLLNLDRRIKVFFDIGANYGTHSLLFLKHGVKTVSFEPNPACVEHFQLLCEMNGLVPNVVPCAVGDHLDTVDFWFPKRDTWLGTMVESTRELVAEEHEVEQLTVELTTIDHYCEQNSIWPDLMKIDTEGNELNVIKGAEKTIHNNKPFIIFECNRLSDRRQLFEKFDEMEYLITNLPFDPDSLLNPLSVSTFENEKGNNFIAIPIERSKKSA